MRRWYESLSKGVQRLVAVVVGAGAVAAAIGSIVALWPDPDPAQQAKLTNISVDRDVTLQQWEDRHRGENNAQANSGEPLILAAYQLAQAETEADDDGRRHDDRRDHNRRDDDRGDHDGGDHHRWDDHRRGGAPRSGGRHRHRAPAEPGAAARLDLGLERALADPTVPELDLGVCGEELSDPDCGLRSTLTYLLRPQSEVTPQVVADRLAELFDHLRTSDQDVPPEPLGVAVHFDVSLTGFEGDEAEIRWSLYNATGGGAVPRDWLRNQRVLSLEAEAEEDSGSGEFWAPLPSREGSYYIRFGVYDEDGEGETSMKTSRFP